MPINFRDLTRSRTVAARRAVRGHCHHVIVYLLAHAVCNNNNRQTQHNQRLSHTIKGATHVTRVRVQHKERLCVLVLRG